MFPALKLSLDGFELRDHPLLYRDPPDCECSIRIACCSLDARWHPVIQTLNLAAGFFTAMVPATVTLKRVGVSAA
jgi:hypothetical protein